MSTPSPWEHFTLEELTCPCGCGRMEMDPWFMQRVSQMRNHLRFPFPVTSGYRCPDYNAKLSHTGRQGPHTQGLALDIQLTGYNHGKLMTEAVSAGMLGIGLRQHGDRARRFIHIDAVDRDDLTIWTYP